MYVGRKNKSSNSSVGEAYRFFVDHFGLLYQFPSFIRRGIWKGGEMREGLVSGRRGIPANAAKMQAQIGRTKKNS